MKAAEFEAEEYQLVELDYNSQLVGIGASGFRFRVSDFGFGVEDLELRGGGRVRGRGGATRSCLTAAAPSPAEGGSERERECELERLQHMVSSRTASPLCDRRIIKSASQATTGCAGRERLESYIIKHKELQYTNITKALKLRVKDSGATRTCPAAAAPSPMTLITDYW